VAQTTTTVEAGILDPVCWYCLQHSGTPLAASQAARELGLGEDVFGAHLAALVRARFVTLVPPLPGAAGDHAPLLYAGDTGLVTLARTGWPPPDYLGRLWCQVILEHLLAQDPGRGLWYWRDAGGGSVDFVVARDDGGCDAIVCAWDASNADEAGLSTLRAQHPGGDSCLVTPHAGAHGTSRGPELGHVIPLGGQGVW
jgi:predicted AAA+ superfamily ATPase